MTAGAISGPGTGAALQEHLDTFLACVDIETGGAGLPTFVTDGFDAFLACGILAHGFLRLRCDGCAEEKLVAFSCKRRGICPSCGTRRMAAHLVDHVIPKVPVRQWVLSFPIPLRSRLAFKLRHVCALSCFDWLDFDSVPCEASR